MSIAPRFNGSKCPTCGTEFIESLDPQDVYVRNKEAERKRRSRAAKKAWAKRKRIENDPDRDKVRYV
jgi:uncharacterized Zn finger protein (UPF0148 family)